MTQMPDSGSETPQKKGSIPAFIWILGGCGCLGVGLFIMAILVAIALPSFLNQVNKARGSEAKSNLGVIARAQQSYRLEQGTFATSIDQLDARITNQFFEYEIIPQAAPGKSVVFTAIPVEPDLRSYTGVAFQPTDDVFISGICETDSPSQTPPAAPPMPSSETEPIQCPPGSLLVE
jgi:type IV pilus assembly protein PilA